MECNEASRGDRRALADDISVDLSALITVPGITPVDRAEWKQNWYWSFTGIALERLLSQTFLRNQTEVATYGNLFAATAFLHGAAVEEVFRGKLDLKDEAYPVTVTSRVIRGDD